MNNGYPVPDVSDFFNFGDLFDFSAIIEVLLTLGGFIFLVALMVYFFRSMRVFPVILVIFIISIVIGFNALELEFPFASGISTAFMLVQSSLFFITCLDVYKDVKSTLKK